MLRILIVALAFMGATPVCAHERKTEAQAFASSSAVLGRALPDLVFVDAAGRSVRLKEFAGRPLLISLVYTGCSDICPALIENLRPTIEVAQKALGEGSFAIITVGFDARNDTPERMRAFATAHGADLPNWSFLSADQRTVDRLAEAVGFTFYPSAGGLDHMVQITVVDREGAIYKQVYGDAFEPAAIVAPLKDAVLGRNRPVASLADFIDRVRLFCTVYDPRTGRYYFNYSLFIEIAVGGAALLTVLGLLVREHRRSSRDAGGRA